MSSAFGKDRAAFGVGQPGFMVGMHMGHEDRVDIGGHDPDRGEVRQELADERRLPDEARVDKGRALSGVWIRKVLMVSQGGTARNSLTCAASTARAIRPDDVVERDLEDAVIDDAHHEVSDCGVGDGAGLRFRLRSLCHLHLPQAALPQVRHGA